MDKLLESLPEEKIEEFAKSEHFETYKKLFKDLGLVNDNLELVNDNLELDSDELGSLEG